MIKEISVDITYKCPFRCIHCSNDPSRLHEQLSLKNFNMILQYFIENHKLKIVEFGGGEPFCHPDFIKMVNFVPNQIKKILYTSGCLGLNDHDFLTLQDVALLKSLGFEQINISVYSYRATIHNQIMNLDQAYKRVMTSLENLQKIGLRICIHIVVTKLNIDHLEKIIATLHNRFNISNYRLLRFVPQGTGNLNRKKLEISNRSYNIKKKFKKILTQFPELNISFGGYPAIIKCRPHDEIKYRCAAGIEFIHILPNSKLIPCPSFKWLKDDRRYSLSFHDISRLEHWKATKRNDCWQKEVRSDYAEKSLF